ncbi:MAG: hypothetical protein F7C81_03205 [Desulfurococcales archaeon]|nr:hypothetical protein [Desulfurococcales archaeon]MEB3779470.1 hypothetical protein [Desulfurococcales archaeon]
MDVWLEVPLINTVMDALKRLSKNGEVPVNESDLYIYFERTKSPLSTRDIVKSLIVLETLGYISVVSSTKEERLIRVLKTA